MKYSDQIAKWLVELGYTHCFYVGGGNIMHLLESFSRYLDCRAVIHEVAAGVAAEYFNASGEGKKALALVTAGPGLTNIVTAMAGAYLESRELLVIGGQVKSADLSRGELRQRGIQEIAGVDIVRPITVASRLVDAPLDAAEFTALVRTGIDARPGPVFLEMPLDVQARNVDFGSALPLPQHKVELAVQDDVVPELVRLIQAAKRPLLLLGGGISRDAALELEDRFASMGIPVATTWNGADRISSSHPCYVGRPNTWGQRSANLVLQQCDLLIALGSRLGMQQTGFNWQGFVPRGEVVQVDIDPAELSKGHPRVKYPICRDANQILRQLAGADLGDHQEWLSYARSVRRSISLIEPSNSTAPGYISPFLFADVLSDLCDPKDVIVPCSSGGAFTVMMQTFRQHSSQRMITNHGLASMGYGLSGAIGCAFANPASRVVLVEGDGGFAQNMQEIGTAAINDLNIKVFLFDDSGYASIRMTQRSYFGGKYIGCDRSSGLGLPDWETLFAAWDVPTFRVGPGYQDDDRFNKLFNTRGTVVFLVSIDPDQTYFPKITSRVTDNGAMESNPLHLMTPELDRDIFCEVAKHLL
jgi:acetolactate synthase-1/2/3 large subunit